MNKINNVFIDNLSLQTNGDVPPDLPPDRVAGKDGRFEIVAVREMKWLCFIGRTSVTRRRRCANGVMSIERGSAMSADAGKPTDCKYWRRFEHLHRAL